MKLILATKNKHKVDELAHFLTGCDLEVQSLFDYPAIPDIVEEGSTFTENALIKARAVVKATGEWALADDSGLTVDALNGEPGIYSSRYAGREKDYAANNAKLLSEMMDVPDGKREGAFICVMALSGPDGQEHVVEGCCEGVIAHDYAGKEGFGYDPIFYLPELGRTMAELGMDEKNRISHRGRALMKIKDVLLDIFNENI